MKKTGSFCAAGFLLFYEIIYCIITSMQI